MFEFHLVGAELAFRREGEVVYQIQLAREQTALPLTRDYMFTPALQASAEVCSAAITVI
jgi:cyclopropane-fatty-acyl-phospholipid synthase